MSDSGSKQTRAEVPIALVVTGFGIGWLAGLSVSPVVSIVLASVTGSVATIIAALSGVKEEFLDAGTSSTTVKRFLKAVTPAPLAWLVFGLIVGASIGLWMRTHNSLSPNPPEPPPSPSLQEEVAQWEALGLPHEEIVHALFERQVMAKTTVAQSSGGNSETTPSDTGASATDTVLFAVSQGECTEVTERAKSDSAASFRRYLSTKSKWQKLAAAITDDTTLREVIAALCTDGG